MKVFTFDIMQNGAHFIVFNNFEIWLYLPHIFLKKIKVFEFKSKFSERVLHMKEINVYEC